MTQRCTDFGEDRPWYARGARRGGVALAAATVVVMFGAFGAAPASAEEIPPAETSETSPSDATSSDAVASETPAPTPPATDEPTDPPATQEPSDPPATEEPAPPTETPTPTPEPTPTPTPTPDPTPTPTPTPDPTPTPEPTEPPATGEPTTAPETPAPGTQKPAPSTGTPRTGTSFRPTTRTVSAAAQAQNAALVAARSAITRATTELREAEAALADARATREVARAVAQRLQDVADAAQQDVDAAKRVYVAAARGGGSATLSSMPAAFGAGHDLLAGLGGFARVEQISGDAEKLLAIVEKRTAEAETAQERADAAWTAVDDVPVESLQDDVANAEQALADARQELEDVQARAAEDSRVAASSISLIQTLPADAGQLSDQGWAVPVAGRISDGFGPRPVKPVAGVNDFHRGTDLAAACQTPVFAATDGVVDTASPNGSLGNWILIDHGSGVATGYGHLVAGGTFVTPGQNVTAGQLIGAVGSTGASTGCHLHFEVHLAGVAVDAVPFMAARGIPLG